MDKNKNFISKKEKITKIRQFLFMSLGCVLLSTGVYFFKIPNGFATGGVTGISIILGKFTSVTPATWIWILNAVFLLLGFFVLGKKTGIKTVYCSMLYSFVIHIFEVLFPLSQPLTNQPFMELCYAMLLTAIGSAVIFYNDSSSGGTDIVALILKKYTNIDVGKALLAVDFFVVLSTFFVFDVQIGLFSLMGLFAKVFIVDGVIESLNACKYFIVITTKRKEISDFIINELHHGCTVSSVVGEFTKGERTMLHTVCKRIEAIKLRKKVKEIDPYSFVIITTSSEIVGRGFRNV